MLGIKHSYGNQYQPLSAAESYRQKAHPFYERLPTHSSGQDLSSHMSAVERAAAENVATEVVTLAQQHAAAAFASPSGTLPQRIEINRSILTSVGQFNENMEALFHGIEIPHSGPAQAVDSAINSGLSPRGLRPATRLSHQWLSWNVLRVLMHNSRCQSTTSFSPGRSADQLPW